jgi:hypothetical protein
LRQRTLTGGRFAAELRHPELLSLLLNFPASDSWRRRSSMLTSQPGTSRSDCAAAADSDLLCDAAIASRFAHAYGEQAFRYFLAVERRRAERSSRPFILVLVRPGSEGGASGGLAVRLFQILSGCLRQTDFIGWFREGRVIGAVLVQPSESVGADATRLVLERVTSALSSALRPGVFGSLRVRIYRFPAATRRLS